MYSRTVTRDIAGYWSNFRCRLWVTVFGIAKFGLKKLQTSFY